MQNRQRKKNRVPKPVSQEPAPPEGSLPIVAIVGRPNVGKSTLFNAWTRRRKAIVSAIPGTTRDRIGAHARAERTDGTIANFELVDTGGLGLIDVDCITSEVTSQIETAIADADLLLFILDARAGILQLDTEVADVVRRTGKRVIVAANKCETDVLEMESANFATLGLGDVIPFSAESKRNLDLLQQEVADLVPETAETATDENYVLPPRVALVGRRNAGKSTITNFLAGGERVVVSDLPGTTRDPVDVKIATDTGDVILVDTAGVGRKKAGKNAPDFFSLSMSRRVLECSEVVMVVFDCSRRLGKVEQELGKLIGDCYRPCVIIANKWDLAEEKGLTPETYHTYIERRLPGLAHAPIIFSAATEGRNIKEAITIARELALTARRRHSTSSINKMIERALNERRPPSPRGKRPKVFYATQTSASPPSVTIFVNDPELFGQTYEKYLQNRFREYWDEDTTGGGEVPVYVTLKARPKVKLDDRK